MLVDTKTVSADTARPLIRAMGTVRPVDEVVLSPRVSGQVVDRSASFDPGERVREGDVLLRIDPADYRNALQQQESALRQAEADLQIEMGRQNIAENDYELLQDTLSAANRDLVLRKPQLNAARSQVESARASVEQARLNLQRTTIRAPFDAEILERNVSVGSQVAPSDNLARLVGRDSYWVEATVPLSHLQWLDRMPSMEAAMSNQATVRIRNRTAWPEDTHREGFVARIAGALENQTRMARVLVAVPDPTAMRPEHEGQPPLVIGSYVEVQLPARPMPDIVRLNRDYLRENDTVWVMENDSLQIRNVDVVLKDATYAYIRDGLSTGDAVITSTLATVQEGAPLRLSSSGSSDEKPLPDPAE